MKAFTKGLAKKNVSIFYLTFHKSNILSFLLHLQNVGSILEILDIFKSCFKRTRNAQNLAYA